MSNNNMVDSMQCFSRRVKSMLDEIQRNILINVTFQFSHMSIHPFIMYFAKYALSKVLDSHDTQFYQTVFVPGRSIFIFFLYHSATLPELCKRGWLSSPSQPPTLPLTPVIPYNLHIGMLLFCPSLTHITDDPSCYDHNGNE